MFFAQRLVSTLGVVWLAATLAFLALHVLPGDAITAQLLDSGAPDEVILQQRMERGLTDPLLLQYVHYLAGLARGDLGTSLLNGEPVRDLILQQLPSTLTLALAAAAVAIVMGITLGCAAALDLNWGLAAAARVCINLALGTPIYWTGTLAIYVFTVQLGLLPSGGGGRLSQLVLPVGVLGFHTAGAIARVVQASIRETKRADFVRTARAKGLPERAILLRHMLRAGLLPVVTVIGLQIGYLIGGTVITESLFVRPGLGRLLLDATLRQDYPVVQGIVIVGAVIYSVLNAVTDLVYRLIDPRVTI
jgi:peptide/nickel transport system permease protein